MKAAPTETSAVVVQELFGDALRHQRAGRRSEAERLYKKILTLDDRHAASLDSLGVIAAQTGAHAAAADLIGQAIAIDDTVAAYHFHCGLVLEILDRSDEALASYQRAVELEPDVAGAQCALANVLSKQGKFEAAVDHYGKAVKLNPDYIEAHFNLGAVYVALLNLDGAAACYERVVALKPDQFEAHSNLGNIYLNQAKIDAAVACYRRAVTVNPDFAAAHYNLGMALGFDSKLDEAAACHRRVIALAPDDADATIALGNILLLQGRKEEARQCFHKAHNVRPLRKRAGAQPKADFSVLLLCTTGSDNTPSGYLVGHSSYDSYFFMLLPGADYDLNQLRNSADVVVNLISDIDRSPEIIPMAADLADRLERPVLNHPRKISATARDAIAARLAGIARCRVPKIARVSGRSLSTPAESGVLADFRMPLLVRVSGTHGGEDFEKFSDPAAIAAFAARNPDTDHYVSEYAPYQSDDGYFRKYRLIFVDGQILPYHLAIADQWKVHHFRTDMANHDWMRAEEEAFVKDPLTVFGPEQWNALRAIQAVIGLDYCGIDCALDREDNLVVFEVNAAMLVQHPVPPYGYKVPYVRRIKDAFDAMLRKAAGV